MGEHSSSNSLSGTVTGSVVQARAIEGDIHVHAPLPSVPLGPPRQLLPAPAWFVDRTEQLAVLEQAATGRGDHTVGLVVISGPGGTGKTALALHALHTLVGRFAGQLYADLGGSSPVGPVAPGAVLGRWLRALGTDPRQVPGDPGEAAALWRSRTASDPVTVLADDAATAAQARALLPGAGLMVVTTRRRLPGLALDGATFLRIGPLDLSAAVELARLCAGTRVHADPQAAQALVQLCGRLPLAVRAATARLAINPRTPIRKVVNQLADARHRLAALDIEEISVTAALDSSYQALSAQAARAYRLLAIMPGTDVTIPAAAAALDTDPPAAAQLIDALAAQSLLDDTGEDRWRLHDLTREHARAAAERDEPPGDRAAAVARVIDYYLHASAAADLAVLPGRLRLAPAFLRAARQRAPGSVADALAWTDAELVNLLAAQQAAATTAGLRTLGWQYVDTLWGWLGHRHDYPTWAQVCQTALSCAQECGDTRAQVVARIRLAACHIAAGDTPAAATETAAALDIAVAAGDRAGEASAREHAGITATIQGNPAQAIREFERGLACYAHMGGHPRGEAIIHRQLGRAHDALGDTTRAHEHYQTALQIFTSLGETYHHARTLTIIAETHLADGQPVEAIPLLQQALPLMEDEDHGLRAAGIHTLLARAYQQTGQPATARGHLGRAMTIYQASGIPADHADHARTRTLATEMGLLSPDASGQGPGSPTVADGPADPAAAADGQ